MDSTYSEVVPSGREQVENREKDIQDWVEEYAEILIKQPGLTDKTIFSIETGEAKPIAQWPYNTPIALKASIDKNLDWLQDHGYIRQSESLWASPMVTVRNPDESVSIISVSMRLQSSYNSTCLWWRNYWKQSASRE